MGNDQFFIRQRRDDRSDGYPYNLASPMTAVAIGNLVTARLIGKGTNQNGKLLTLSPDTVDETGKFRAILEVHSIAHECWDDIGGIELDAAFARLKLRAQPLVLQLNSREGLLHRLHCARHAARRRWSADGGGRGGDVFLELSPIDVREQALHAVGAILGVRHVRPQTSLRWFRIS
nr:hypothetical protein SHINE37_70153 [Rhizobiaceae bacterium]